MSIRPEKAQAIREIVAALAPVGPALVGRNVEVHMTFKPGASWTLEEGRALHYAVVKAKKEARQ